MQTHTKYFPATDKAKSSISPSIEQTKRKQYYWPLIFSDMVVLKRTILFSQFSLSLHSCSRYWTHSPTLHLSVFHFFFSFFPSHSFIFGTVKCIWQFQGIFKLKNQIHFVQCTKDRCWARVVLVLVEMAWHNASR